MSSRRGSQSPRLLTALQRLHPAAPVAGIEGNWAHTHEFRSTALLPYRLVPDPSGGIWVCLAGNGVLRGVP